MKKTITLSLLAVMLIFTGIMAQAQIKREQRGVWMTAYVGDWPSSPILEINATSSKTVCNRMLDSLQVNNFNTIFYHVRAMCDAMYDSAYEPWSSYVSGTRGVAPFFDPFEYLLTESHKRGLEVYAWINPYRYASKTEMWGQSDRDYVNTHPDWLVTNANETCLNPGLPEVEQRIVDVVKDIMSKYDIDGIVFDDYFYNAGGLPLDADANLYNKYTAAGGTLSQADWRRENVNTMVRKVNAYIKSTKPYVRFGISPAGIACTNATSAPKYGLPACPGYDWQYNQIYSDPVAWLKEGTIDFISPQVYWPINGTNDYSAVTTWWSNTAKKFDRHLYVSQSTDALASTDLNEFVDEVNLTRNVSLDGAPGTTYFKYGSVAKTYIKIDGKFVYMPHFMKRYVYQSKALLPAVTWLPGDNPALVEGLKLENDQLTWTGVDNMKYVVYAVPQDLAISDFHAEAEYILGVSYAPSFTIPTKFATGYTFAVSSLDRYGNEGSTIFLGMSAQDAPGVTLSYPTIGEGMGMLDSFEWDSNATQFIVEIGEDAAMSKVITSKITEMKTITLSKFSTLESGKTYYWRVISRAPNCRDNASVAQSFVPETMHVVSPSASQTEVELNPTITWTKAAHDASYTIEISKEEGMGSLIYNNTTNATSITLPQYVLCSNMPYYMKITAKKGEETHACDVLTFTTKYIEVGAPKIKCVDGAELFSNSKIWFEPEAGVRNMRLEISASNTFPVRSSYTANFENFEFSSPELSLVKISSSALATGKTYYVRARYDYNDAKCNKVSTDYCTPISFIYNEGTGVGNISSDAKPYIVSGNNPMLVIPAALGTERVQVVAMNGAVSEISQTIVVGRNEISLSHLAKGAYLIKVISNNDEAIVIKFVK